MATGTEVVVVTVRERLDEEAAAPTPPAIQQPTTTQMTMGITTKSTIAPIVAPTIIPTRLLTVPPTPVPRGKYQILLL